MCNLTTSLDMTSVANRAASSAFWASGQKGPLKKQYASEQQKVVVVLKLHHCL